jgi:hypothetical protein
MDSFLKEMKFHPSVIRNLDETSCQVKPKKPKGQVVPISKKVVQIRKTLVMYHLTALFIVQSNGRHQQSHLLVPSRSSKAIIDLYTSDFMTVHQTIKGWMDKQTFAKICKNYIIPGMVRCREMLPITFQQRGLLILDGASSRFQRELFLEFQKNGIDVSCIPSHTSGRTQPLDNGANHFFKEAPRKKRLSYPRLTEEKTKLVPLFDELENAMEEALLRPKINLGFNTTHLSSNGWSDLLPTLEDVPPKFKLPQTTRFTLGGNILTSDPFMKRWEEHDSRKASRGMHQIHRLTERLAKLKSAPKKTRSKLQIMISHDDDSHSESDDSSTETNEKDDDKPQEGTLLMKSGMKKPGRPKKLNRRKPRKQIWEGSSSESSISPDSTSEAEWEDVDVVDFVDEEEDEVFPLSEIEIIKVIEKIKENQESRRKQREADKATTLVYKLEDSISEEEERIRKRLKNE